MILIKLTFAYVTNNLRPSNIEILYLFTKVTEQSSRSYKYIFEFNDINMTAWTLIVTFNNGVFQTTLFYYAVLESLICWRSGEGKAEGKSTLEWISPSTTGSFFILQWVQKLYSLPMFAFKSWCLKIFRLFSWVVWVWCREWKIELGKWRWNETRRSTTRRCLQTTDWDCILCAEQLRTGTTEA